MAKHKKRQPYPWDRWFRSKRFTVVQGRDFTCSTNSMYQQIRNVAAGRGKRTRVSVDGNSISVKIFDKEA